MKTKLIVALCVCAGTIGFAQKQELREAAKAVKSGNLQEAKQALTAAEGLLGEADDKQKAHYYFLKGEATTSKTDLAIQEESANAYNKVLEIEEESGHTKYTADADLKLTELRNGWVTKAIEDQQKGAYKEASEKLYMSYKTNKADTTYLYYAASNSVNAKDYDVALEYYNELVALGFDGKEKQFIAINKENGKEESFGNKEMRDISVKAGTHIKPEEKISESKKSEIAKNVALIYISQGKDEEALKAMELAKQENPEDTTLLQAEADMYYKLGNIEKYKVLMEQIVAKDPNNPDLLYNLGVSASKLGDNEKALEYYEKVLKLKPDYGSAQLNIASLILGKETSIVDEMNKLGTSSSDYKKYEELKMQRMELYKQAVPYLKGSIESNPDNIEAIRTLMNIYYQLDDSQADDMKNKLKALEGGN